VRLAPLVAGRRWEAAARMWPRGEGAATGRWTGCAEPAEYEGAMALAQAEGVQQQGTRRDPSRTPCGHGRVRPSTRDAGAVIPVASTDRSVISLGRRSHVSLGRSRFETSGRTKGR